MNIRRDPKMPSQAGSIKLTYLDFEESKKDCLDCDF